VRQLAEIAEDMAEEEGINIESPEGIQQLQVFQQEIA